MKLIRKVLLYVLSVTMIVAFMPAAFAAESETEIEDLVIAEGTPKQSGEPYKISVEGTMAQDEASELLDAINSWRVSGGLDPLQWDNGNQKFLTNRAAELAINYSEYNLIGEYGGEDIRAHYDDITDLIEEWQSDVSIRSYWEDPNNHYFCAGTYRNDDGKIYIAASFYEFDQGGDSKVIGIDNWDTVTFKLMTIDKYLNCKSEFLKKNYSKASPKNLRIGNTYYYWIRNYNENNNNERVLLNPTFVKTSNKAVASITKEGTVKAKRAGTATLTVKPAANSGYKYTKKVVVRPAKTKSVKATTTKKSYVKVTWAKQAGVSGYQVYRSTKKGSGFKRVKTITSAKTVTFKDRKAKKGKTYYYKVRAYVKSGTVKYPGAFSKAVKGKRRY